MTPLLEARQLVKSLGGRRVVDGVDLECHGGQILGLLGPNGAGKTTTLRMLYGFLRPDGGTIRFDGLDAGAALTRVKRHLGVCTQDDTFDGDFSVEQNLTIAARYFRPGVPALRRRVDDLLDRFGLRPYAAMRPEALSGGFKRRLMIARALVHRPRVLFLDEPTTGLDPEARGELWREIARLARDEAITVLLTTHYLEEADRLADRLAIVDRGRIVAEGTADELKGELSGEAVQVDLADAVDERRIHAALAGVTALREVTVEQRTIRARADRAGSALPAMLSALEANAAHVAAVHITRPSLDDVYLRHTGRKFSEADTGAAL